MDITGIQTLEEVIQKLRYRGVRVLLCEANERVLAKLLTAGVVPSATDADYGQTLHDALQRCELAAPADGGKDALDGIARRFIDASRAYLAGEPNRPR
jgi:SulP family sulfate permease